MLHVWVTGGQVKRAGRNNDHPEKSAFAWAKGKRTGSPAKSRSDRAALEYGFANFGTETDVWHRRTRSLRSQKQKQNETQSV